MADRNDIVPLPDFGGPLGGHGHLVPSRWNPLKEQSIVITDHNTGRKFGRDFETVQLPEGPITIIKR